MTPAASRMRVAFSYAVLVQYCRATTKTNTMKPTTPRRMNPTVSIVTILSFTVRPCSRESLFATGSWRRTSRHLCSRRAHARFRSRLTESCVCPTRSCSGGNCRDEESRGRRACSGKRSSPIRPWSSVPDAVDAPLPEQARCRLERLRTQAPQLGHSAFHASVLGTSGETICQSWEPRSACR